MSQILKAMGIGVEIGDEASAQKLWSKWLNKFGYHPQQAFPDNITQGTNRVTYKGDAGASETGRKSTIVNHLFNPTYKTYTYYDLDSGIPLMTRTRGVTKGDLVAWAGIIGFRDVLGRRIPEKENPLKTTIVRTLNGKPIIKEIFRLNKVLERKGKSFRGNKPRGTKNPENPNEPWWEGLPIGADENTKEQWLESNYPEYHKWLVENLHQPLEAKETLQKLGMSKDKVEFLKIVDELTPPDLLQTVINKAIEMDNDKWHIVVLSNDTGHLRTLMMNAGFHELTDEVYAVLLNDKLSSFMQEALEAIGSKHGKLTGEKSSYYIRQIGGGDILKADWFNTLKVFDTPDKDDEEEEDPRRKITFVDPNIQEYDPDNIYDTISEPHMYDFCCDFMKETLLDVVKDSISTMTPSRLPDNLWNGSIEEMDCTQLNNWLDTNQDFIVIEPDNPEEIMALIKHKYGKHPGELLLSDIRDRLSIDGILKIRVDAERDILREGAKQGMTFTPPRTLAEVYEECLLSSRAWLEDPESELSDDLRGKYSKEGAVPGEVTLDEMHPDDRPQEAFIDWWERTKGKKRDRWRNR